MNRAVFHVPICLESISSPCLKAEAAVFACRTKRAITDPSECDFSRFFHKSIEKY